MNAVPDLAHLVHAQLLTALRQRRAAEHSAAVLLRRVADEKLHHALGYASIFDYAEQALDLSVRQTRGLLQIGGALASLPKLDAAFASGALAWTKVREVIRVATPETDGEWAAAAATHTSRALEAMVSTAKVGEPPRALDGDPRGSSRRRVVFEMEASDAEVLRDALALIRAQGALHGAELDDGAALAALAQRVLFDAEGEGAPIAERYRVVVTQCGTCGDVHAAQCEVSETIQGQAACDAEIVDLRPGPTHGHLTRTIPPATRRAVLHRDGLRCVVPGCSCRLWLDVHHLRARALGGTHDERNLVTLCATHHRLVHDGRLGLRWTAEGIEATHADGRVAVRRVPTWVG
jgi:5-methylcytosine-specific restriction endonuclease McrA